MVASTVVRGGVEEMRRLAVALVSVFIAVLFVQPASAQTADIVYFSDKPGDLGHPVYDDSTGLLEPAAYWPDASPVGSAGYLDMTGGWMSIDEDGKVSASLTVASPWTSETVLPNGVKAVWWTWFLYKGTDYFEADYAVHFCWDGSTFEGVVLLRGQADPMGSVSSCSITGDQVLVEFDVDLVPGAVAWFAESICWNNGNPHTDDGYMPSGSWFAADISDGPFLPWLPMPVC